MAKGVRRDHEVLDALRASLAERGRMPTEKELIDNLNIHRSQLHRNLKRLVLKGAVKRDPVGTLRLRINEGAQHDRV